MIVVPFKSSVLVVEAVGLVEDDRVLEGGEEAAEVEVEVMEEDGVVDEDTEDEEVAVESEEEAEVIEANVGTETGELEVADDADVLIDGKVDVTNDVKISSSSSSPSSLSSLSVGDGFADVDDVDADVDKAVDVDAVVSSSSASSSPSVINGPVGADVGGAGRVVEVDSSTSSSSFAPLSSASFARGLPNLVPPGGSCVGSGSSLRIGAVTSLPMSSSSSSSDRKSCTSCGLRTNIRLLPGCCERTLIPEAPG